MQFVQTSCSHSSYSRQRVEHGSCAEHCTSNAMSSDVCHGVLFEVLLCGLSTYLNFVLNTVQCAFFRVGRDAADNSEGDDDIPSEVHYDFE